MINGVSRSNAFELANSRYWHIKRLEQISGSKSPLLNIYSGSEKDTKQIATKCFKEDDSLISSGGLRTTVCPMGTIKEGIKNSRSMPKIGRKNIESIEKEENKHWNAFYDDKRKKKSIESENKNMMERIKSQKSRFSLQKDKNHFKKSREVLKRIEKFSIFQRFPHKIDLKARTYTEAGSQWKETKLKLMDFIENPE